MPDPAPKPGFNQSLKIGIPLAISALAMWLVLRQLDFQAVGDAFRLLTPTSIGLIVLCFSAGALLRGLVCWILRWKTQLFQCLLGNEPGILIEYDYPAEAG